MVWANIGDNTLALRGSTVRISFSGNPDAPFLLSQDGRASELHAVLALAKFTGERWAAEFSELAGTPVARDAGELSADIWASRPSKSWQPGAERVRYARLEELLALNRQGASKS